MDVELLQGSPSKIQSAPEVLLALYWILLRHKHCRRENHRLTRNRQEIRLDRKRDFMRLKNNIAFVFICKRPRGLPFIVEKYRGFFFCRLRPTAQERSAVFKKGPPMVSGPAGIGIL